MFLRTTTSILCCDVDVGALALNAIGFLEGRRFIFNGILFPEHLGNLNRAIYEILNLAIGKTDTSNFNALGSSTLCNFNGRILLVGKRLSYDQEDNMKNFIVKLSMEGRTIDIGRILIKSQRYISPVIGYAESIKGSRVGKNVNDDGVIVLGMSYCYGGSVKKVYIGIVADGVTSLGKGYFASSEAIKIFISTFLSKVFLDQDIDNYIVLEAYRKTAKALANINMEKKAKTATTFTATIYPVIGKLQIVHVGDTRAYLFTKNRLVQLTKDDKIPGTSVITKSIGIDISEPQITYTDFGIGDIAILTSDGIYEIVSEEKLKSILIMFKDPKLIVEKVIDVVRTKRGIDDASIGVIKRII